MSSNAIRGPRRATQAPGDRAATPSSGVRAAPSTLGPSDPTPPVGVRAVDAGNMHASSNPPTPPSYFPADERTSGSGPRRRYDKVDVGRLQFDSGEMTQVASPNPMLLAVARGELVKAPRRLTWFAAGMAVGAIAVWCATSDVRGDIFAARVHVASILRSLRGQVSADDPPGALVIERSGAPSADDHAGDRAGDHASDPSAQATTPPTVDVSQLPRVNAASVAAPSPPPLPSTPVAAPPPGTPTLANAPGPR